MPPMWLWKRLLLALQRLVLEDPDPMRTFELDEPLRASLLNLAEQEQRPVEEVTHDLLRQALSERRSATTSFAYWGELTPRQQEVTARVSLGYTNQRVAARLSMSPETVKTHISNILGKFNVH